MIDGEITSKLHSAEKACTQLLQANAAKSSLFYTGLALYNIRSRHLQVLCELFQVHFHSLSKVEISAYVSLEQPLNCADSFKSEGLGIITLFDSLKGCDSNALIDLSLIALLAMR